jgi:DNA-binding CsgD family transcriptional regulator
LDKVHQLIADIYQAAAVPETWPDVLHSLGDIARAPGAILLTAGPHDVRWVASRGAHDDMLAFMEGRWYEHNTRQPRLLAAQHAGFLRDVDIFPSLEAVQDDYLVREFFRPRGLGWGLGTVIPVPSGDMLIFSIDRLFSLGPVEQEAVAQLDLLRPHLARAALLSSRLGLQRAQMMANVLSSVGLPAAVLRQGGILLTANSEFENLLPLTIQDRSDRIALVDKTADKLLEEALARVSFENAETVINSIPLPAREGRLPLILHVLPIRGAAHDIFAQAASLLVVTAVNQSAVPTATVLQALFDLSPAEARVARHIAEAKSVEDVATTLGVSRETVRSQLKSVLAKTGVARQQELIALLAGKALPPSN